MRRRSYLATVGTLGTGLVAGCPGDNSDTSTPASTVESPADDDDSGTTPGHSNENDVETTARPLTSAPTATPEIGDALDVQGATLSTTSTNGAIVSGTLFNDHDYGVTLTLTAVLYDTDGGRITTISDTFTYGRHSGDTFFLQYQGERFEDATDFDITVSEVEISE
jgi:hypothetical protein